MKKPQWRALLCALVLGLGAATATAAADYQAASQALQNKDYATALPLLRDSAKAGNSNAMNDLARMYWNGMGVPTDHDRALSWLNKAAAAGNATAMNTLAHIYLAGTGVPTNVLAARHWAEKSAALGNANSATVYFQTVILGPELDYKTNGKPDLAKYTVLAKRTLAERALDQKAYDMLGQAITQGDSAGKMMAAVEVADKVGPGNRARALALMAVPGALPPALATIKSQIDVLNGLGESYSNLSTFMNARRTAVMTAVLLGQKAGLIGKDICAADELKVKHTAVSRPLAGATYLPTSSHDLQNVFLIAGNWQESWSFDACGKAIEVPIEFQADGFGGAYFQSKASPAQ